MIKAPVVTELMLKLILVRSCYPAFSISTEVKGTLEFTF